MIPCSFDFDKMIKQNKSGKGNQMLWGS